MITALHRYLVGTAQPLFALDRAVPAGYAAGFAKFGYILRRTWRRTARMMKQPLDVWSKVDKRI